MAELPPDLRRITEALTRLAVVADRLGIDHRALHARLPSLGMAPGRAARVSLDPTGRLALRCQPEHVRTLDLGRPADARWLELETIPGAAAVAELDLAFGSRPLPEDRARLAAAGVPEAIGAVLASALTALGVDRCDGLGRRGEQGAVTWTAHVVFTLDEAAGVAALVAAAGRLTEVAARLGVPEGQRRLLGQAHTVLAPGKRYAVALACSSERLLPQLTVEYQGVAWQHVVGLTDALHPGTSSGPRFGAFAGAFAAAAASALELTFCADREPVVRASVELGASA